MTETYQLADTLLVAVGKAPAQTPTNTAASPRRTGILDRAIFAPYSAFCLGVLGLALPSVALATFVEFDVPGAIVTYPQSINLAGVITGYYYGDSSNGYGYHGFVRAADGTITSIDFSGR